MMIPSVCIDDYDYILPDDRIAKYPLEKRDSSKLLIYRSGAVDEKIFRNLPEELPDGAMMVFNDTKVVPARMHFRKESGALIEIFCLEPVAPAEYNQIFSATDCCRWKCIVGNAKKWKSGKLKLCNPENSPEIAGMNLNAELVSRDGETSVVEFAWNNASPFSKVLEVCGTIPIPPYLNRESEDIDKSRYQTLYAKYRGSVAAPTAGLHFTDEVLENIRKKGILEETVCLHVGAGTFLPVKSHMISGHPMHREPFNVSRKLVSELLDGSRKVIAVGTTSVRTLESLYYLGVKCMENGFPSDIEQWMPYESSYRPSRKEALGALLKYMDENGMDSISAGTRIIIVPGYEFHIVDMLVTNFHQPQSTLLLLISAFVGGDWKTVYDYALSHDFRFLSYGDSSLLFRK